MINMERSPEKEKVNTCNSSTIPCRNCKWSILNGPLSCSCIKFKDKPNYVYYRSEDCPKFEER